jgi:hypothetical protein
MIMKNLYIILILTSLASFTNADPGTAFTYQGRLADGTTPIETAVDLRFSLWDATTTGSQIGNDLTFSNAAYDGGIVQLELDFGSGSFNGDPRWLEIELANPTGGTFVILDDRIEIDPVPYAIYAETANSVVGGVAANRIPIESLPYEITASGSYYLPTSLSAAGGITINANYVTLDLNGFSLTNTAGDGILLGAVSGVCIQGGMVTGCSEDGIDASAATLVTIEGVKVIGNSGTGIRAGNEATIQHCTVNGSQGNGIRVVDDCDVLDNVLTENGDSGSEAGIRVTGDDNLIENNSVLNGYYGIRVEGTRNYVKNNFCKGSNLTGSLASRTIVRNFFINEDGNQLDLLVAEIPFGMPYGGKATLTGNLASTGNTRAGIVIASDNVTVDLNGFEITGQGTGGTTGVYATTLGLDDPPDTSGSINSSADGVYVGGNYGDIVIKNGSIRNWGGEGIDGSTDLYASRLEDLILTANDSSGIWAHDAMIVRNCTARLNGTDGVETEERSILKDVTGEYSGSDGLDTSIGSVITDCIANFNEDDGFQILRTVVGNCSAEENLSDGYAGSGLFVNSSALENGVEGFRMLLSEAFLVANCSARGNGEVGFDISTSDAGVIHGSTASQNDIGGFRLDLSSITVNCTAFDNGNDSDDFTGSNVEDYGFWIQDISNLMRHCVADGHGTFSTGYVEDTDGAGIVSTLPDNLIDENTVTNNEVGIRADNEDNFMTRNRASNNATDYNFNGNSLWGPIVNVGGVGNITSQTNSGNRWANFAY